MSFYDLTKDFVLSAKELFKHRGKRDNTLPSKGGQKDFEPDESWLQSKALESFLQERTSVLAEPRVEKLKNLVKGNWDDEKGLINVEKPGKFWAHMGFTDKRRNWLYPEEALFLMESNTLEVCQSGVPFSIQEAYDVFLGSDVSIEEYQVFSHLRRLGFVVTRHENQPVITPYERQINLDKYIDKKSRKDRTIKLKKNKSLEQNVQTNGTNNSNHSPDKTPKLSGESDESFVHATEDAGGSKNEDHDVKDVHAQENNSPESGSKSSSMEVEKCSSETDHITTDVVHKNDSLTTDCCESDVNASVSNSKQSKRPLSPEEGSSQDPSKRTCLNHEFVESNNLEFIAENLMDVNPTLNEDCSSDRRFYDSSWDSCFIIKTKGQQASSEFTTEIVEPRDSNTETTGSISLNETSNKTLKSLPVPDIANSEIVILNPPSPHLLPENVDIEDKPELLNFDVEKYHIMNPPRDVSKQNQREEERRKRVQGLVFSLPEWMQKQPKLPADNWKEYKHKLSERITEISKTTPVDHLWKGKVTPLLHPGQSWSHQNEDEEYLHTMLGFSKLAGAANQTLLEEIESILDKLSIIKSADNETLLPDSDCVLDVKIVYDVHLPDSRFKKSLPGVPNHRVCVSKCLSDLPGLAEIHQVWSRFKDTVPLHWAVVDSGDIAFYVFDSSRTSKVFL